MFITAIINCVFISFSEVQIHDFSYNHLLRVLLLVKSAETSLCCFVLIMSKQKSEKSLVLNLSKKSRPRSLFLGLSRCYLTFFTFVYELVYDLLVVIFIFGQLLSAYFCTKKCTFAI